MNARLFAAVLIVSLAATTLFAFAFMVHGPGQGIASDCGMQSMGMSLCPLSGVGAVIHHISSYQSFLGAHQETDALLAALVALAAALFLFIIRVALAPPPVRPSGRAHISLADRRNEPLGWLARFELSPSRS